MTNDAVGHLASTLSAMEVVDLSAEIFSGMPLWSTHPVVSVEASRTFDEHGYFCQTVMLPEHAGAHVDAPAHVRPDLAGATVDLLAPDALLAPAWKVDASGEDLRPGETLSLARFDALTAAGRIAIGEGDIVLFEFGWDRY